MRKFFYGTSILMLAAGMAFAQSTTPDQSTSPSSGQSSNSIQGCLSGSDNNFTLTD
jgi:hypothetical protein